MLQTVRHVAQFLVGTALLGFSAFRAKEWDTTALVIMSVIALCLLLGTDPIKLLEAVKGIVEGAKGAFGGKGGGPGDSAQPPAAASGGA